MIKPYVYKRKYGHVIFNRAGSVLLLTFIFMVGLTVVVGSYIALTTAATKRLGGQVNNALAYYLAEAGLHKGVYYLKNTAPDGTTDASWRTLAYPSDPGAANTDPQEESLGAGTYVIWVEDGVGNKIVVTSRGDVNGIQRTVRQILNVTVTKNVPEAFQYAAYVGQDISFANSRNGDVKGDVQLGGSFNGDPVMINGSISENQPMTFPEVDLEAYQSIADNVVVGNKTFTSGTTTSGIWYVTGNVTFQQNVTLNGTVIALGAIDGNNAQGLTITAASPYPAMIAIGDVNFNNIRNASITGLIYTQGDLLAKNAMDTMFDGGLVIQNTVDIQNAMNIMLDYDSSLVTNPPPYFTDSGGGGTVTTIEPEDDSWGEL